MAYNPLTVPATYIDLYPIEYTVEPPIIWYIQKCMLIWKICFYSSFVSAICLIHSPIIFFSFVLKEYRLISKKKSTFDCYIFLIHSELLQVTGDTYTGNPQKVDTLFNLQNAQYNKKCFFPNFFLMKHTKLHFQCEIIEENAFLNVLFILKNWAMSPVLANFLYIE